jgi:hypothetical protein
VLATECRQLALAAETAIEKTVLARNRIANETDRYVDFLKKAASEKSGRLSWRPLSFKPSVLCRLLAPDSARYPA